MLQFIMPGAYGHGYRAGRQPSIFIKLAGGEKVLKSPMNPYPVKRFISYLAWKAGEHDGRIQKLTTE